MEPAVIENNQQVDRKQKVAKVDNILLGNKQNRSH